LLTFVSVHLESGR